MTNDNSKSNPILETLTREAGEALGEDFLAAVLYGSAARGDYEKATSDLNVLLVTKSLTPAVLETLDPILTRWTKKGHPLPRLFTPDLIAESGDVFPIEFHDIRSHGVLLTPGANPFDGVEIHHEHLRIQCEREIREKMMRLREGYVQTHMKPRMLVQLLSESFSSFVAIFRGCLHLMEDSVPVHNTDVVREFCATADLDPTPFESVERLKHGDREEDPKGLFLRYYEQLGIAVHRVNRFEPSGPTGGNSTS